MNLKELQHLFSRGILEGDPEILDHIKPGGTLRGPESFEVYRTAYQARLTEALGEIYEAVWRMIGDEDFFAAARDFIESHQSASHNLNHYGAEFPSFLAQRYAEHPFLAELASFEWKFAELFHKPHHRGISLEEGQVTPLSRIRLVDSQFHIPADYAIYSVWQQRESEDPPEIDIEEPEPLVAYKKGDQIYLRPLSLEQSQVLTRLEKGAPLEDALSGVSAPEEAIADLFAFLAQEELIKRID